MSILKKCQFQEKCQCSSTHDATDKLIWKRQRTDHPRHRHDNRRDDRSTDMTTEEMTEAQTERTADEKKGDLTRTQDQRTGMDDTKHRQMNS